LLSSGQYFSYNHDQKKLHNNFVGKNGGTEMVLRVEIISPLEKGEKRLWIGSEKFALQQASNNHSSQTVGLLCVRSIILSKHEASETRAPREYHTIS